MKNNIKSIFFVIFLCSLVSFTIQKKNNYEYEFHFNQNENNEDEFKSNPYLILKLPPWSTKKEIEDRVNYIRTNGIETKEVKDAYNYLIKEIQKEGTKTFYQVIINFVLQVIIYEAIIGAIYLFLFWTFKIQEKFKGFFFCENISFVLIETFIPHFFTYIYVQYIVSFIVGILIFLFKSKVLDNKEKSEKIE